MVSPKTRSELNKHANLHGVSRESATTVYNYFYKKIRQSPSKKNNKTIKERAIIKTHNFLRGCLNVKNDTLLGSLDARSQVKIKTKNVKKCR